MVAILEYHRNDPAEHAIEPARCSQILQAIGLGGAYAFDEQEQTERATIVRDAIEQLSFEHREVIVLKNFEGRSYREMAEMLDVPIGTIMSRLFYARKALKEIIEGWERAGVDRGTSAREAD